MESYSSKLVRNLGGIRTPIKRYSRVGEALRNDKKSKAYLFVLEVMMELSEREEAVLLRQLSENVGFNQVRGRAL